jgi:hypothetical protein
MKIEYVKGTRDGKTSGSLTDDFVAKRVANKMIEGITLPEDQSRISFGLSGGGILRFRPKPGGGAEIAYVPPTGE